MSVLSEIAAFVAEADIALLGEPDRDLARRHFSDTIIALTAGSLIPEGRSLLPLTAASSFAEWVGFLSATARLTEIDDIHIGSCVTPSAVTVPVAMAFAGCGDDVSDMDVLSAAWVGTEVMTRLGTAIRGPHILGRGVWPTFAVAPFGAAAVVARLLRLTHEQTAHALSLALMMMSGGIGHFTGERSGRWLLFASSVAAGIRAAMAAREGYTGDLSLLDRDWLSKSHGIDHDRIATDFSEQDFVYRKLSMKPYCSAKQSISAIEAFGTLLDDIGSPRGIVRIVAEVPEIFSVMVGRPAIAGSRSSTLVNLKHPMALRALQPEALYDIDRSKADIDPAIVDFANRIELTGNAALMGDLPNTWGAKVTVFLRDGGRTLNVSQVRGDPERPLLADDLLAKWRSVFSQLDQRQYGEEIIAAVVGAPVSGKNSRQLLQLCAPTLIT